MSSYNNIRKIKYTKTPSDVVALQEYIIFEDSHAKEKYVVFKFANNLNQRLLRLKFEVLQYNEDNELIEKSTVLHENFVAEPNDLFVPNAKLKINFKCESLEVVLSSASFDRVVWSDGEFKDNSYRFSSYAETVTRPVQSTRSSDDRKKSKDKTKKQKRNKLGFDIRNIFSRNKAVFPSVFNAVLCVIVIGLVVFSTFYFKIATGAFAIDGFAVVETSPGYVTILDYSGGGEEIEIPSSLKRNDERYYVIKIAAGAFRNSNVKTVELKTEKSLLIETGAFSGCANLTAVTGSADCGTITLMEGAFTNCQALDTFFVPTARLCAKCFDGTDNIKNLSFNSVVFSEGKLLDIFNGLESITLDYFYMNSPSLSASFLEGVRFAR